MVITNIIIKGAIIEYVIPTVKKSLREANTDDSQVCENWVCCSPTEAGKGIEPSPLLTWSSIKKLPKDIKHAQYDDLEECSRTDRETLEQKI